jgi:hypothetical protein
MIDFSPVAEADDEDLRALLRENPMSGWVSLSVEREPSFSASLDRFGHDRAVIARDGSTTVGMYLCSAQPVNVNGVAEDACYLGGLRVSPDYRHRRRILREGYASILKLAEVSPGQPCYTSIAVENTAARRLLEAGLPDLPRYRPIGDMVTLALPKARGVQRGLWRPAKPGEMEAVCQYHGRRAARFQFSPRLSAESAARTGAQFFVHDADGSMVASMALWNQQDHKQVVARGYRPPLGALLPLYNLQARLRRTVQLPRVGAPLDQTFLAFFAAPALPDLVAALVAEALARCPTPVLTFGLYADHPCLPRLLEEFRPLTYRTRIYAVDFGEALALDGRPVWPEPAIL